MIIFDLMLFICSIILSLYVFYNFIFVVGYPYLRLSDKKIKVDKNIILTKFAIIVPAHNEELIIGRLLESVKKLKYSNDKYELIIIADNCDDETERIVRLNNTKCLVRNDKDNLGKPKALDWALNQIDLNQYDAITIVDADTELDPDYLEEMHCRIAEGGKAIQGYFGVMNPDDTWLTRLMVIPGVIKFKTRYFCKDKMGISCPLMGNGMCFTIEIIKKFGWNAFSITENWEYYLQLLNNGYEVSYCESAKIYSHAVKKLNHGIIQRKRWQKGRLLLLKSYLPEFFIVSLKNRSLSHIDALIELSIPSFSMLLNFSLFYLAAGMFYSWIDKELSYHVICALLLLATQLFIFIVGLIVSRASWKTWISIIYLPLFLIWKISVTFMTMKTLKSSEWEKTERKL